MDIIDGYMVKKIKLHLGCGFKYLDGYIHIDKEEYPHIDYVGDATDLKELFNDNSVDLIYASHLFEHVMRKDVDSVLKEWYRVLKPNGILRLAVPDFEALVKIYQEYKDIEMILGPVQGRGPPNQLHYMIYDFRYLKKRLEIVGFRKVRRWNWKEELPEDFDDFSKSYFPHMDFEDGMLISLNVEAMK